MMKTLNDLTIREFYEFQELIKDEVNPLEVLEFFGVNNTEDLEIKEFEELFSKVMSQKIEIEPIKKEYLINGKLYHPVLEIQNIKAAQFIDLQTYIKDFKYEQVLSVFMLPIKKEGLFKKKSISKYNSAYDMNKLQNELLDNMRIGDAVALSGFFFNLSMKLLPIIRDSLTLEMAKEMKWLQVDKKIQHQFLNGSKQ